MCTMCPGVCLCDVCALFVSSSRNNQSVPQSAIQKQPMVDQPNFGTS